MEVIYQKRSRALFVILYFIVSAMTLIFILEKLADLWLQRRRSVLFTLKPEIQYLYNELVDVGNIIYHTNSIHNQYFISAPSFLKQNFKEKKKS